MLSYPIITPHASYQMSALQEESREKDRQVVALQGMLATFSSPPGSAAVHGAGNSNGDSSQVISNLAVSNSNSSASTSNVDNSSKKWERAVRVLQAQLSQMQASHYRQVADHGTIKGTGTGASSNNDNTAGGGGGDGGKVSTGSSSSGVVAVAQAQGLGLAPALLGGTLKSEIESLLNGELLEHMDALTMQNNALTNELKVHEHEHEHER